MVMFLATLRLPSGPVFLGLASCVATLFGLFWGWVIFGCRRVEKEKRPGRNPERFPGQSVAWFRRLSPEGRSSRRPVRRPARRPCRPGAA